MPESPLQPFKVLVIAGPSGVGKGTVIDKLKETFGEAFAKPLSCTTREPRAGEIDGEHYRFLSREEFDQKIKDGDLLEWAEVTPGKFYGIPKSEIVVPKDDKILLMDLNVDGAEVVKRELGADALYVFIDAGQDAPLSVYEDRISARNSGETEQQIQDRLANIPRELERGHTKSDVVIHNDEDLKHFFHEMEAVAHRLYRLQPKIKMV